MPNEQLAGRTILIVERDRNVRELQSYALNAAGFSVEFADDGEAAFAYARSHTTVLIVTEILTAKIDGLALCRRLRAEPATCHVPVLVFSILAAAARAEEAGATAFLRKPFIESTFIAAIDALVTSGEL